MGESCTEPVPEISCPGTSDWIQLRVSRPGGHIGKRWPTIHSRNETEQSRAPLVSVFLRIPVIRLSQSHTRGLMRRWVNLFCLCFALTALRAVAASPSKIAIIHVSVIDVRAGKD